MKTFNPETRQIAFSMSSGYCQCSSECTKRATQMHHKLPNTKVNQRIFPRFLHSIFNACPINHDCHATKPIPSITVEEAKHYERWFETFEK